MFKVMSHDNNANNSANNRLLKVNYTSLFETIFTQSEIVV